MQPPPGPQGYIAVVLTPTTIPQPVRCWINGHEVFSHEIRGATVPVPAGRYEITCEAQGRGGFGKASITADVVPGQTVTVHYAAPHSHISRGAIGFAPQTRHWGLDLRQIAVSLGGAVALICLCGGIGVLWERLAG
ncbi:hypothetical protein ACRTEC_14790 [Janibacter indicus]